MNLQRMNQILDVLASVKIHFFPIRKPQELAACVGENYGVVVVTINCR